MKRPFLGLLAVLAAGSAPAQTDVAPLPPNFVHDLSRGEGEFYEPIPNQRGIYAHGYAGREIARHLGEIVCRGSEAEQDTYLKALPAGGLSEFWFYGTKSQGVRLSRTVKLDPEKPCSSEVEFSYDVERAFVADGFIHSLQADDDGSMFALGTWPITYSAAQYSGGFMLLHNLMARPVPARGDRERGSAKVAGVAVNCRGASGLVWWSVCTAVRGPAKGMILKASAGDDESISFNMEVKELRPRAMLPGLLFEIERSWTAKAD